jgi:hypothetical protein
VLVKLFEDDTVAVADPDVLTEPDTDSEVEADVETVAEFDGVPVVVE